MLDQLFRGDKYTADELNARLKFFIGIILGLTLFGIVFVVLYSCYYRDWETDRKSTRLNSSH